MLYFVPIAVVAHAQNDSCESLEEYVDQHSNLSCYIYQNPLCYGMYCSNQGGSTTITYGGFYVQRCEDPVTVYTYARVIQSGHYHYYSYTFNQSETVDTNGYFSDHDHSNHNLSSLTAFLDRNSSHLGFEVINYRLQSGCMYIYLVNIGIVFVGLLCICNSHF